MTARRAKRENGGLGEDPPGGTMTYLRTWMFSQGSLPTAARRAKRENGDLGEDPPGGMMTYQQVLRTWMFSQSSLPTAARRAKRENGGLGEDPPGSLMTYQHVRSNLPISQTDLFTSPKSCSCHTMSFERSEPGGSGFPLARLASRTPDLVYLCLRMSPSEVGRPST
jgi:hypothetical protein